MSIRDRRSTNVRDINFSQSIYKIKAPYIMVEDTSRCQTEEIAKSRGSCTRVR